MASIPFSLKAVDFSTQQWPFQEGEAALVSGKAEKTSAKVVSEWPET